jgi:hypothetical protein
MRTRLLILSALGAALAACGHPTPYQPAPKDGGGYAEQQIEADRYRVTFSGNALTSREAVENALLYRAAELTLANRKDYFVLVSEAIEPQTSYRSYDPDFPSTGFGHRRWNWDPAFDSTITTPITRYDAYAEIVLFAGPKPQGDVRAFDAREVVARLGPTLVRPQARS